MRMNQGLIPAQAKWGRRENIYVRERKILMSNYINRERRIKGKSGGRVNL